MKYLIIVESPAKAKTITGFLNKEEDLYTVVASKGHIRDLPKSNFGITISDDGSFTPKYCIEKSHAAIVKEMKGLAGKSDNVFIATDEDREGEAIGFHIAVAVGKKPETLPRIVFHEITKSAILDSLKNPRSIDINSVNAQQARRLLDRIVGYKLSPLLSSKIQKGLSAGRVQSAALKIVVDREREIRAFKQEEYWSLDGLFDPKIEAVLVEFKNQKIEKMSIRSEAEALKVKEVLQTENYEVFSIETKKRTSAPQPPFMTSTLQQSASSALGFSPKRTMGIAQKLYEGVKTHKGVSGVITYMRTDSLNIAKEAIENARMEILKTYGKDYLPEKVRFYSTKSKAAQEAHEAIRPTMIDFTPKVAKEFLEVDELKLYTLIYNRFLASQMTNAVFESQSVIFASSSGKFKANGRKLLFDGFYIIYGESDKDMLLPNLKIKDAINLKRLDANQHFTEPPARYSEASLINKLESLGIGRPSTYAPTISILTSRDYIKTEKKQVVPSETAFDVTKMLEDNFPNIVDSNFTSIMEDTLDLVAEGKKDWQKVLADFYFPFEKQVTEGKKNIQSIKMSIPTGEKCPLCNSDLVVKRGRYGEFTACSAYPKCKFIKKEEKKESEKTTITTGEKCPLCNSDLVVKRGRYGEFTACSAYPKCKFIKKEESAKISTKCPDCGGEIVAKKGRFGKFFGCSNYPKCKFISKTEPK